jgi:two-component system, NarL family, nitrate/nitrite response regulator NarL
VLRIALISGSPLVLAGLRAGLHGTGEFDVVWASRSIDEARLASFGAADVAVIDIHEETEPAAADALGGPALVLLVHDQGAHAGKYWQQGYSVLPHAAPIDKIAAAARAAAVGLVACEPRFAAGQLRSAHAVAHHGDADTGFEPLTPRERQVLAQMSAGLGNREIAQALNISAHTAKFHVAQVMAKLDASSRAHAVAKGLRAGLVTA